MTVTVSTGVVEGWSIDELATLAGVPSRTIREYKTLGLLPAPKRVGRVGVYGEDHRRRLELIARLQTRGYSLAGIRDLLDAWAAGRSLADLIGDAPIDEMPRAFTREALASLLPALAADASLTAACDAGLIVADGPDRWLARSEALLTLVADLVDAGTPIGAVLDGVRELRRHTRAQGAALADVFVTAVWDTEEPTRALTVARRARPLISQAVASLVTDALGDALLARADDEPRLRELVAQLRVGRIAETIDSINEEPT
jgi:DNA-binding transcriptional MerR regulator